MPILFLVVFFVMAGFAMLLPSIMYVLENLGASQAEATPILASYSLSQFIIGPVWGRLSDWFGRRPILIITLVGASACYLFLATMADTPAMVLLGLTLIGIFSGNTSVVMAAVSDLTAPENRAKGLGLMGAGIGLAFTLGPAVGGIFGGGDAQTATISVPAAIAAGLLLVGALVVAVRFRESHTDTVEGEDRISRLEAFGRIRTRPILLQICLMMLCFTVPLSMMESVLSYFMETRYQWGPPDMSKLFFMIGLILMLVQGGLIGRLTLRFGEISLARVGVFFMGVGLFLIMLVPTASLVYLGIAATSLGTALFNTSMAALASHRAKPTERGAVMGVFQSMQSLGRSTGPLTAGLLNQQLNGLPLLAGGLIMVLVLWWVVSLHRQIDRTGVVRA
ncbi:Predicted arabinose efflux permease, MFS family [Kordiimonas lacus]|jgi:MFS family permease|uniref:Predicted arabinose efflux permease, MFS family n=2 Tax=Kordiimonadaceae TaxID=1331809 RepID=A0A1G7CFB9_9PROT|nr:Predicted arabinose efflux permease, MFS family [Kordiimonas lacus]